MPRPTDQRASELVLLYEMRGGLATADEVAGMLGRVSDQPISCMARWIARRQLVQFNWQSQKLLPLFQFDLDQMTVREEVQQVVRELAEDFDDDELAHWFTQPHALLQGEAPLDALKDGACLLQAARAERFLIRG